MNIMDKTPAKITLHIDGMTWEQVREMIEERYGALMWDHKSTAYPTDSVVVRMAFAEPSGNVAQRAIGKAAPQQEAREPAKLSDEQIKAHGDKASRMMARDLTRFDAACEVDKYLREQGAPGYYRHRMSIVLFGNAEGTEAARAPDTDPQQAPAAPAVGYPPLPRVGAIGYASVVDIESYAKTLTIGPHLPGVRDIALWTTDQMRAYVDADRAMRAAQQPGAAYAALPDELVRLADIMRDCGRLVSKSGNGERILRAAAEALRAPHGQAPAQASPAAVAGSSDDLVTRESAMQAIEHLAISNSPGREDDAIAMLAAAPTTQPAPQPAPQQAPQPSPAAQGDALSQAARDVLAERRRQIEVEGWTPEHDDKEHLPDELALAAASYVCADEDEAPPAIWPWDWSWWKPRDRRRNLIKSGALILAELERIDRADATRAAQGGK